MFFFGEKTTGKLLAKGLNTPSSWLLTMGKNMGYIGAVLGGIIGFSTPAAIGQIPPLTALPEEVFTVPVGTALGAIAGYYIGRAL